MVVLCGLFHSVMNEGGRMFGVNFLKGVYLIVSVRMRDMPFIFYVLLCALYLCISFSCKVNGAFYGDLTSNKIIFSTPIGDFLRPDPSACGQAGGAGRGQQPWIPRVPAAVQVAVGALRPGGLHHRHMLPHRPGETHPCQGQARRAQGRQHPDM
jgi:hypothetical protein